MAFSDDPPVGIPPAEVEITDGMVARLLIDQHPDLANLDLQLFGSGWDNTTYRLGANLAIRLPRRALGVELILKEQRWLAEIASTVPVAVPAPIRVGVAGNGYPWPWSIVPWVEGDDAVVASLHVGEVASMASVLRSLHRSAPLNAPRNPFRGVPNRDRAAPIHARIARISPGDLSISRSAVAAEWERALSIPIDTPEVWIHGDLHPRNVITRDGRLHGLVDWGDMCAGDPATDLAAAWLLFEPETHSQFREAYGPISEATWERARGWAVSFGAMYIDSGAGHDEPWADVGRRVLERACR